MATMATSLNIATQRVLATSDTRPVRLAGPVRLNNPWNLGSRTTNRMVKLKPVKATPEGGISDVVEKSIKEAQETCAGDPVSGECVAAWDEVEELSAAASHARDKKKAGGSDPLEEYCKDNPETNECRTYDN
ncbi:Calvin cycle protein CP12-2 [Cardamine amara subsp. amara]|uniref:Calvin cycle protein CP12-2 n=1 Tax=Cardamine amara subsp. amara TaxID=228776 RepID=A0ABD1BBB2_CARAN